MKKLIFILISLLFLCGCTAPKTPAEPEAPEVTEAPQQITFYEGTLESAPLTTYALADLMEYFPYSSAVENNWCGAVDELDEYNHPDVSKDLPGGVLRKYEYAPGEICKYSVYSVAEGGYFYIFWDTIRGKANAEYETAMPEMWSSTMLYVPALRNRSDFDTLEIGVSTGGDVTDIDPGSQFVFTLNSKTPSWHLLDDGSMLEILYQLPEDCGCTYVRDKLVITSIIQYAPEEANCALAHINPEDLP